MVEGGIRTREDGKPGEEGDTHDNRSNVDSHHSHSKDLLRTLEVDNEQILEPENNRTADGMGEDIHVHLAPGNEDILREEAPYDT